MFRSFLHSQNWAHFRWLSTFALSSKLTAAFRQLNNFVLIILKTKTTVASGIVQVNLRETLAEYFSEFFSRQLQSQWQLSFHENTLWFIIYECELECGSVANYLLANGPNADGKCHAKLINFWWGQKRVSSFKIMKINPGHLQ